MSQKTENVKLAYLELDYNERIEIQQWIRNYEASTFPQRDSLKESFNKSLGQGQLRHVNIAENNHLNK